MISATIIGDYGVKHGRGGVGVKLEEKFFHANVGGISVFDQVLIKTKSERIERLSEGARSR